MAGQHRRAQPAAQPRIHGGLRDAWDVPNGLPAPSLAIQIGALFLRTEPELVLQSCRAVPGRLLDAGFQFKFPAGPKPPKTWCSSGKTGNREQAPV
jgi:NAD dependent epimerase/dehydratase family enzyme